MKKTGKTKRHPYRKHGQRRRAQEENIRKSWRWDMMAAFDMDGAEIMRMIARAMRPLW